MSSFGDQPSDRLEEVFRSVDPIQVGIARDLLEGSGMECFVFDAAASRMLGSTAAVTARLMVHRDEAEEARERLKELGFQAEDTAGTAAPLRKRPVLKVVPPSRR